MYEQYTYYKSPQPAEARELLHGIAATSVKLSPREVDKPLALYGAGNLGRLAFEYFKHINVPVSFVVDNNATTLRLDQYWQGIQLFAPEEVPNSHRKNMLLAVCIANAPYVPIASALASQGWEDILPFYDIAENYRHKHPLSNGWFADPFSREDVRIMENVLDSFFDNTSRAHHLQFIAWRRLRQEWVFMDAPVNTCNRFFIPELTSRLSDDDTFADIGAHHGSVIQRFIENRRGHFRQIWAIEGDGQNLATLKKTLASLDQFIQRRINVIHTVVASDIKVRKFQAKLGYASQCATQGDTVHCRTIDDLNITPTFMKLHLEGMELESLRGALQTIRSNRPVIAATVYHNSDGLWALPLWLQENLADYTLLMRVHSWCGTGAVVYCIPEEPKIVKAQGK